VNLTNFDHCRVVSNLWVDKRLYETKPGNIIKHKQQIFIREPDEGKIGGLIALCEMEPYVGKMYCDEFDQKKLSRTPPPLSVSEGGG
jgi:hypothetical protein